MNVQSNISNRMYDNRLNYPRKPVLQCNYCNITIKGHRNGLYPSYCATCGSDWKWVKGAFKKYIKDSFAYNKETNKLLKQFKQDLFEEFGVSDNPKANKCYELAWEHGHSCGLFDVYYYFSDFVALIK